MTTTPRSDRPSLTDRLLPADAARYRGPRWVPIALAAYATLLTGRSLVHLLAPDGGAQSIATIDTGVAGGDNIIGMFGQWGAVQLLLALVVWVVLWRYRGLVPLMTLILLAEPLLRMGAGALKPIETVGTAPGAVADWVTPVLLTVLLLAAVRLRRDATDAHPTPDFGGRRA
jgi:hypothetical protein